MKSLCLLLAAAVIQGVIGQQDTFSVEPTSLNVVPEGAEVVLDCITREPVTCAWKLKVPEINADGFLNSQTPFLEANGIRVRDQSPSTTDCSIIIDSVEMRHSGNYTCSPFVAVGQADGTPAEIVVAVKPAAVEFVGENFGALQLTASAAEVTEVTCQARDGRPRSELRWFLGEQEITDGLTHEDDTDPDSLLVTSRSTLTHQFQRQDEGAELKCQASHPAYGPEDERQATMTVTVLFAPVRAEGSDLGTLYGFTAGEDRDLTVNFTANPAPTEILWNVGPLRSLPADDQTPDGRIIAGPLETVDAETHQYALRLTFSPVESTDQNTSFSVLLGNGVGQPQELTLRVAAAPPPPPAAAPPAAAEGGVSGGAIGGIIVAVILLIAIIALVALARSRGMWCFAAKPSDAGAEALVTKKKEGDVEAAANKEETKELTAPDGEGSPKREKPEVVYAELVLDKDGVKTEVRPSPEKTEYAVIVGTKTPEAKE